MSLIHGNEIEFKNLINDDLVLVDFYATWCGPCRMLSTVLDNVSSSRNNLKIVKMDVDENMSLAKTYGVMSVPTLVLFKNGKEVAKTTGFMSEEELLSWVNDKK